jgi:uncharacterized protein involved in exopolysaccharide biosynthesis
VNRPAEPFGLQPFRLAAVLMGHWRLVLGVPLGVGLLAAGVTLLLPKAFESRVLILPEDNPVGAPTGLANVASQFGITLPSEPGRSPAFYGELIRSGAILGDVLHGRYRVATSEGMDSADSSMLDLLGIRGATPRHQTEAGVERLRRMTSVDVRATGLIDIRVRAPDPQLSMLIAERYVEEVNRFNAVRRQSQARQRRVFVDERAAAADSELRMAEDSVRAFYESNREWQSSPRLMFEEGRLRRQLELRQELLLTLRRELESARIAEVNDAPVVTVIEPPVAATRHVTPKRTYIVIGATGLAFLLVSFGLFAREYRAQMAATDAAYDELRATWGRFLQESRLAAVVKMPRT